MFKNNYKHIFDTRAESYHRAMTTWPKAREQEFKTALSFSDVSIKNIIIDMPSGGGYLSWYVPEVTELYHIETSAAFTQNENKDTHHPTILTDENSIPFNNNSVDRFFSIAGLHHTPDKKSLFSEIKRVLKPDGIALITDTDEQSKVSRFLDEFVNAHNTMGHQGYYLNNNTLTELNMCGLKVTRDETISYQWLFDSINSMSSYCRLLFGIDEASQTEIINGVEQFLGFRQTNTGIEMNWELRFLRIEKQ